MQWKCEKLAYDGLQFLSKETEWEKGCLKLSSFRSLAPLQVNVLAIGFVSFLANCRLSFRIAGRTSPATALELRSKCS